ncbi:MAG: YigZ family protein, partial [Campylobacter sp.]
VLFTQYALGSRLEHYFEKRNLSFEREFNEEGAIWRVEFNGAEFDEFYPFASGFEQEGFKFYALPLAAKG